MKIYIDGKYLDQDDAKVSVFDHGLLYGDGIFEGIRAYNGRIFRLEDHLQRLNESARRHPLNFPMPIDEIGKAIVETVRVNKLKDAYIRLVVTRGVGDLGLDMRKCQQGATLFIIADKIELYPEEFYEKGLTLVTSSFRQKGCDQVHARRQVPQLPRQHPGPRRGDRAPARRRPSCSTRAATSPSARATTSSSSRTARSSRRRPPPASWWASRATW